MGDQEKQIQLRDDVALITGSRRGIGLGIARELAGRGFRVVINSTSDPAAAEEALDSIPQGSWNLRSFSGSPKVRWASC